MKTFKIPVTWEMCGLVEVQANEIEEAIKIAKDIENNGEGFALPTRDEYVDDSFVINDDIRLIKLINGED